MVAQGIAPILAHQSHDGKRRVHCIKAEDCTGVTTFEPAPGVVITETFVIVNRGLEVFSIASDPPPNTVSAVQKKIGVH